MSLLILNNLKGNLPMSVEIFIEEELAIPLQFQLMSEQQLLSHLKITAFNPEEGNFLFPLIQNLWREDRHLVFLSKSSLFTKKLHQALFMSNNYPSYLLLDEKINPNNPNYDLDHLLENSEQFFHLSLAGQQSHISHPDSIMKAEPIASLARLAEIKGNSPQWQYIQRENEVATLCLSALKSSELLCNDGRISSSGLLSEELAQISYNIGSQSNNRCFHLKCIENPKLLAKQIELLTQSLWYYLHGKLTTPPVASTQNLEFQEFIVEKCLGEVSLSFLKSKRTQQWWFKIPFPLPTNLIRHQMQPCLYEDYLNAKEGELSDFILGLIERFDQFTDE
jgi:hypothetical protein